MTMQSYLDYLVDWLQGELIYRQAAGFVVGVSGGIDSAVVAYLLAKANRHQSLGLILPCHSAQQDQQDAELVLNGCQLPYSVIDLSQTHQTFLNAVGHDYFPVSDQNQSRVIDGNARARLRMAALYTVAQSKNYIVVGTDNAAEWYTGYFTKFGDGGVDIAPLLHLTKHEVYELASLLGVPESIIHKAPSAGLWDNQTDEGEMGTTYEMITTHLQGKPIPEKDRQAIDYWHQRSHHKRALPRVPKPYARD